jgi:hypothetical protein
MIMQPVRFFLVMSSSLAFTAQVHGQVEGLSTRLHGKRIHRFTCRVRTPRGGPPGHFTLALVGPAAGIAFLTSSRT